jgi:prepilin peptidase CpaA
LYYAQQIMLVVVVFQLCVLLLAGWSDVASRIVPNRYCVALALSGLVGQGLSGSASHVGLAIVIAAILFVPLLMLHGYHIVGGGDVKLLTAIAIGLPPLGVVSLLYATALIGGVLAVAHLAMRRLPRPELANSGASALRRVYTAERWRIIRHAPLPYGVAIACAGIWAVLTSVIHTGG